MIQISNGTATISFTSHAIERDATWIAKAKELAIVKQSIKQFQEHEQQLLSELIHLSEGVDSRGGGYIFKCTPRKGSVQYKDIPQLKGVNLDHFRAESVNVWKLEMELK